MVFKPRPAPEAYDPKYFEDLFRGLEKAQYDTIALELRDTARAPTRPRTGTIIYADGTNFNPGQGAGPYAYNGSRWVFLAGGPAASLAFTATAGGVAITSSNNVASVQRNSTGNYTVLFTSAIASSNYVFHVSAGSVATNALSHAPHTSAPTATQFRFQVTTTVGTAVDVTHNCVTIFGAR